MFKGSKSYEAINKADSAGSTCAGPDWQGFKGYEGPVRAVQW